MPALVLRITPNISEIWRTADKPIGTEMNPSIVNSSSRFKTGFGPNDWSKLYFTESIFFGWLRSHSGVSARPRRGAIDAATPFLTFDRLFIA